MGNVGEFLESAFREVMPEIVLDSKFKEYATQDISKFLFEKGVKEETFKRCIGWHIRIGKSFITDLFSKAKTQQKPHWEIINHWNHIFTSWKKETERQVVNESIPDKPYRKAHRKGCEEMITGLRQLGVSVVLPTFVKFYKEAGFTDFEIELLAKEDTNTSPSELGKFIVAMANNEDFEF